MFCPFRYIDGTFDVVPSELFYQLFTIHGVKNNVSIPLLYVLLPNKRASTYSELFRILFEEFDIDLPKRITSDFESGILAALRTDRLKGVKLCGCFVHFQRCIIQKLKSPDCRLWTLYSQNSRFNGVIHKLMALSFTPTRMVLKAYNLILEKMHPLEAEWVAGWNTFKEYMEKTWIGSNKSSPEFSISLWNNYLAIKNRYPITNNSVEGWHNRLNSKFKGKRPHFWKLVEALLEDQQRADVELTRVEEEGDKRTDDPNKKSFTNSMKTKVIDEFKASFDSCSSDENLYLYVRRAARQISNLT